MTASSSCFCSMAVSDFTSFMLQMGHVPGWSCTTAGCIGQVKSSFTGAGATVFTSFMPQMGQVPA